MQALASGNIKRLVYVQLAPGDDLYQALLDAVRSEGIKTGLVLDITGGLSEIRLSTPTKKESVNQAPGLIELKDQGSAEVTGHGIVGLTKETYHAPKSGIFNNAGEPYVHVHVSVSCAGNTYCGHLIDGCIVRSVYEWSHFTIVLAEVEGVELSFRVSEETTDAYPKGIPYHELIQL